MAIAIKMAMISTTTINSMRVKPSSLSRFRETNERIASTGCPLFIDPCEWSSSCRPPLRDIGDRVARLEAMPGPSVRSMHVAHLQRVARAYDATRRQVRNGTCRRRTYCLIVIRLPARQGCAGCIRAVARRCRTGTIEGPGSCTGRDVLDPEALTG